MMYMTPIHRRGAQWCTGEFVLNGLGKDPTPARYQAIILNQFWFISDRNNNENTSVNFDLKYNICHNGINITTDWFWKILLGK